MHLKIIREKMIDLISAVQSVIERKHVLNILANIKIELNPDEICMTGTDLEVELIARAPLAKGECIQPGIITVPARKLFDICKALQNNSIIDLKVSEDGRCTVKCNQSKFALGSLPAADYPSINRNAHSSEFQNRVSVNIGASEFKQLFEKTAFSMAVQDVRFYLTGTLIEIDQNIIRAVTTDGHRLSICEAAASTSNLEPIQAILPKKAVNELQRLLQASNERIELSLGRELVNATLNLQTKDNTQYTIQFTTKMIDGKYPDYRRVVPSNHPNIATVNIDDFKQAIHRVSILSNERNGYIIITFEDSELKLVASNNDLDEANEYIDANFNGEKLEVAFSAQYITEILNCLDSDTVEIQMKSQTDSVLIIEPNDTVKKFVVMPRRA